MFIGQDTLTETNQSCTQPPLDDFSDIATSNLPAIMNCCALGLSRSVCHSNLSCQTPNK